MHRAAQGGHKEFAECLFALGASVTDKDEVCCKMLQSIKFVCGCICMQCGAC